MRNLGSGLRPLYVAEYACSRKIKRTSANDILTLFHRVWKGFRKDRLPARVWLDILERDRTTDSGVLFDISDLVIRKGDHVESRTSAYKVIREVEVSVQQ